MKTEWLEAFAAVAETRNFTRAAQELYVDQTAVSRRIAALERELGCALFERDTRHVALTQEGQAFLPRAAAALAEIDAGRSDIGRLRTSAMRSLRLGFCYLFLDSSLLAMVDDYSSRLPQGANASVSERDPKVLLEEVASGALDGGMIGLTSMADIPVGFEFAPIRDSVEKVLMGHGNPLGRKDVLDFEDIAECTFIYPFKEPPSLISIVKHDFERHRQAMNAVHVDFLESAVEIIARSEYVMNVPDVFAVENSQVIARPYRSESPIKVGFVYNPKNKNPILAGFVDTLTA